MRQLYKLSSAIFAATLILNFACQKKSSQSGSKLQVVVSIPPLAEFVEQIGGERVEVHIMVPPGASPHSYEPLPSQMKRISGADMYVKIGTPIEFEVAWLAKLLGLNKGMHVVDASLGIKRIVEDDHQEHDHGHDHHHHGGENPHIWLSLRNTQQIVRTVCDELTKIDPEGLEQYKQRCSDYLEQLKILDQKIAIQLGPKKYRRFLVYHPAWGYFARDYHLHELSIEQDGKAPTLKSMQAVINQAQEQHIHTVLTSPQFNQANAERIAREIKGTVALISPMEKNYLKNMEKIANILVETLE